MWKKVSYQLDEIIKGEDLSDKILEAHDRIIEIIKPDKFGGEDGLEVIVEKNFHETSLILSEKFGVNTKEMNSIQYLTALERLKKDGKSNKSKRLHSR